MKKAILLTLLVCGVILAGAVVPAYLRSWQVEFVGSNGVSLQHTSVTCGPAALTQVLSHYGTDVTEEIVAEVAGTTDRGTSLLGLVKAAEHYGYHATGYMTNMALLRTLQFPAIAVFKDHYVTIVLVAPAYGEVIDPLVGRLRLGTRAFAHRWRGQVLVITPIGGMRSVE